MELTAFTVLVGSFCVVGISTVIYGLAKSAKLLWRKVLLVRMLKKNDKRYDEFLTCEITLLRTETKALQKDVRELLDLFAEKEDGQ